ncbi:uncharacterized protein TNCV_1416581 [Trichonephila clavipes]|nr:uncharacterized protein TNCV_1416581 [Trichonephila clavipes]
MATVPLHAHGYRSHTYTFPSGTLGAHQAGLCEKLEKSKRNGKGGSRCRPFGMRKRPCDEAHFWLNGYVTKQNCHIWSEANPQVYVETPLHPEKLTVWCALWAGGILLQKR